MRPINKQDVLIRLLKDGHISNEEFKVLWESMPKPIIREVVQREIDEAYEQGVIRGNSIQTGKIMPFSGNDFDGVKLLDPLTKEEIDKISKDYYDAFNEMKAIKDSLRKDQETTIPPQGMHPKTWAFLNKQNFR